MDDSRMMTETEFKRHECGEQLFTQLKCRIATRVEQGLDKYGKLQHYASTPNVCKDDVIHPQSIAVHVPARMYEAQNMTIPHHEWRTQHPANRPPLKLHTRTWTPSTVRFARVGTLRDSQRLNAARALWKDYKAFYRSTLVFRWYEASTTTTIAYCPGYWLSLCRIRNSDSG